jgi:hypothetical protein
MIWQFLCVVRLIPVYLQSLRIIILQYHYRMLVLELFLQEHDYAI